jgi:hypothetical protein
VSSPGPESPTSVAASSMKSPQIPRLNAQLPYSPPVQSLQTHIGSQWTASYAYEKPEGRSGVDSGVATPESSPPQQRTANKNLPPPPRPTMMARPDANGNFPLQNANQNRIQQQPGMANGPPGNVRNYAYGQQPPPGMMHQPAYGGQGFRPALKALMQQYPSQGIMNQQPPPGMIYRPASNAQMQYPPQGLMQQDPRMMQDPRLSNVPQHNQVAAHADPRDSIMQSSVGNGGYIAYQNGPLSSDYLSSYSNAESVSQVSDFSDTQSVRSSIMSVAGESPLIDRMNRMKIRCRKVKSPTSAYNAAHFMVQNVQYLDKADQVVFCQVAIKTLRKLNQLGHPDAAGIV